MQTRTISDSLSASSIFTRKIIRRNVRFVLQKKGITTFPNVFRERFPLRIYDKRSSKSERYQRARETVRRWVHCASNRDQRRNVATADFIEWKRQSETSPRPSRVRTTCFLFYGRLFRFYTAASATPLTFAPYLYIRNVETCRSKIEIAA